MNDKKTKIQFGPEDKQKEVMEACEGLFDPDQKSPDKVEDYEFTYIDVKPVGEWSQPGFIIEWGVKKVGFGQLTFYTQEGQLNIDSECMSKEFAMRAFKELIEKLDNEGRYK